MGEVLSPLHVIFILIVVGIVVAVVVAISVALARGERQRLRERNAYLQGRVDERERPPEG